jgi:hypothetical protein
MADRVDLLLSPSSVRHSCFWLLVRRPFLDRFRCHLSSCDGTCHDLALHGCDDVGSGSHHVFLLVLTWLSVVAASWRICEARGKSAEVNGLAGHRLLSHKALHKRTSLHMSPRLSVVSRCWITLRFVSMMRHGLRTGRLCRIANAPQ